jgi:hypothetical protein
VTSVKGALLATHQAALNARQEEEEEEEEEENR